MEQGAEALGVRLSSGQLAQLGRHVDLLLKWNRSINLTAITALDEVVEKHVLDSLAVVPALAGASGAVLDAGSGGGFPGIPLAIVRPDLQLVMVDSVQKKVAFLKNVLADLRLTNARAAAVRLAGAPEGEGLPRVQIAIARAYAAPADWLALASRYLTPSGLAICMMGPADQPPESVADLRLEKTVSYALPSTKSHRRLAVYRSPAAPPSMA
jgi:16S rRNA (guanine527-N7)-methyltransferase